MLALNKTKAALQGRLSHFSNFTENSTTLIDQVNARRFARIFSNYGENTLVASDQHFGSIPRLSNSRRNKRFIHPDLLSSPSSFMAIARRSDSSLSKRSCTTWRSFGDSDVDIVNSCKVVCLSGDNVHQCMTSRKAAKPEGATNTNGPLTKPLIEVTVMADHKSTQTHSEFTWRFLAVSESHPQARAVVVYTTAPNEAKARSQIKGCVLYFAARLPAHHFDLMAEVRHV
ncbi:TPA: host cell division inhibitor Icd-like protein [Yersinia enterocolitica]